MSERLFYGHHVMRIESKGRVSIPSTFKRQMRPEDEETLVITRGISPCLFAFPITNWFYYVEHMRSLDADSEEKLLVTRAILAWAQDSKIDSQNRFKIPTPLFNFLNLDKEVILSGHKDRFEIWDKAGFYEYQAKQSNYDSLATKVFEDMSPESLMAQEERERRKSTGG